MSEHGYIVISDITGYTAFLSGSELEHAEDSLRSLLNLLLEHTKPPLVISRLEGDAVISYAPQGSFLQGQSLVETLENTYVAFRQALERMERNTTCTCDACRNIPNLDLKFFVHHGAFMLQHLGSHIEMVGSDVNLIHRLTKNGIVEEMGIKAYAVYTQAAIDALGIAEMCPSMTPHTESYEHIGAVATHVQDMNAVWLRERDRVREFVRPEEALLTVEYEFPLEPVLLWDYLTKPEYRAVFHSSDNPNVTGQSNGRTGPGTVYYCAHGKSIHPEMIADWQPFERLTLESQTWGTRSLWTLRLVATATGTRVSSYFGRSTGPVVSRILNDLVARLILPRYTIKAYRKLEKVIREDLEQGRAVRPSAAEIPPENVEKAVAESLAS